MLLQHRPWRALWALALFLVALVRMAKVRVVAMLLLCCGRSTHALDRKALCACCTGAAAVLKMPDQKFHDVKTAGGWMTSVEIPWSSLVLGERIGSGGFAEVFHGKYKGMDVAVKRLLHKPGSAGTKAVDDFKAEVAMMTRLRHPNIGACLRSAPCDMHSCPSGGVRVVPLLLSLCSAVRGRGGASAVHGDGVLRAREPV